MKSVRIFLLAGLICLSMASCKDNDYKGDPHLIVTLTDATSDQFTSLVTSLKRIELYGASEILQSEIDTLPFDIMQYTGYDYLTIFDEKIPEGHYSKLRLVFGTDNLLTVSGETSTHEMISGSEDLVWECDLDYEAVPDRVDVASIDLDINQSVSYNEDTDEYHFSPRNGCRLMDAQTAGAVSAVVVDVSGNVIVSGVQVQFFQKDTVLRSTYCSTTDGRLFYRLSAGAYDIHFIPRSGTYAETILDSVVVNDGDATSLGSVVLLNNY